MIQIKPGANLIGADLRGANLYRADFRRARGLTPEQVMKAKNYDNATFDADFQEILDEFLASNAS